MSAEAHGTTSPLAVGTISSVMSVIILPPDHQAGDITPDRSNTNLPTDPVPGFSVVTEPELMLNGPL
jgi:hypothetical protein